MLTCSTNLTVKFSCIIVLHRPHHDDNAVVFRCEHSLVETFCGFICSLIWRQLNMNYWRWTHIWLHSDSLTDYMCTRFPHLIGQLVNEGERERHKTTIPACFCPQKKLGGNATKYVGDDDDYELDLYRRIILCWCEGKWWAIKRYSRSFGYKLWG